MASFEKPWMLFVDGENFTIRAQELARRQEIDLSDSSCFPLYVRDTFFWPADRHPRGTWWPQDVHTTGRPERCYYYTSTGGDEQTTDSLRDILQGTGFTPVVIRKPAKQKKSKGVDISLTKDMLVNAFLGNYDVAALVAGDADYIPVIEEVKRLGKWVVLGFFDENNGLSPKLRRAADRYVEFSLGVPSGRARRLSPSPPRAQIQLEVNAALKSRLESLAHSRTPPRTIREEVMIALDQYLQAEEKSILGEQ